MIEEIISLLEDEAILYHDQAWLDEQLPLLESWLSKSDLPSESAKTILQRFLAGHPSPNFLEQERANFRSLRSVLKKWLRDRYPDRSNAGEFRIWCEISGQFDDFSFQYPFDAKCPPTGIYLFQEKLQDVLAAVQFGQRGLEEEYGRWEQHKSWERSERYREELFYDMSSFCRQSSRYHGGSECRDTNGKLGNEYGEGDGSGYFGGFQDYPDELEGNIEGLYVWGKEYLCQQIVFLDELKSHLGL